MEENNLIEQFMSDYMLISNASKYNTVGSLDDTSTYHNSWNLLMPVVKRIREIINTKLSIDDFKRFEYYSQRLNAYDYDIDKIHSGVIEFIKSYNHHILGI